MKPFVMKYSVITITERDSMLDVQGSRARWTIELEREIPDDDHKHRSTPLLLPPSARPVLVIHVVERPDLRAGDWIEVEVRKAGPR